MNLADDFVQRALARRKELGVSLRDLAERMRARGFDWHHTTVTRTESGRRPLRLDEAAAIAEELAIPLTTDSFLSAALSAALADRDREIADLKAQLAKRHRAALKSMNAIERIISNFREGGDDRP